MSSEQEKQDVLETTTDAVIKNPLNGVNSPEEEEEEDSAEDLFVSTYEVSGGLNFRLLHTLLTFSPFTQTLERPSRRS